MKPDKWYLLIILTFLIWGTQHPFLKILSNALPSLVINVLRFSITLLVLLPFVVAQKTVPAKKDFFKIAGLGVIGIACYGFFVIAGLQRSTSINCSILINTHPLIAAVLAPFLLKEKLSIRGWLGISIGFIGMVLVLSQGFHVSNIFEPRYLQGNLLLFLSGICLALYALGSKFFVPQYGSLVTTFYAVLGGTAVLFVGAGATGQLSLLTSVPLRYILIVLYVAIVTTAFTWVIWFKAIQKLGICKAEPLFFLLPVSGVVSANILLGERITRYSILGAILILVGIYLVQKRSRENGGALLTETIQEELEGTS